MEEVRTAKGKLIGVRDTAAGTLRIKDGVKITSIQIPQEGLRLTFDNGRGTVERVCVKP
jgi:hypothetical protein